MKFLLYGEQKSRLKDISELELGNLANEVNICTIAVENDCIVHTIHISTICSGITAKESTKAYICLHNIDLIAVGGGTW